MILYNIFDYQEKIYDYKYDKSFDYLKLILFDFLNDIDYTLT
jgi:hypothetical protein